MSGLGTGLASQWTSPVTEGTYGVAASLAGAKFTACDSDTLELKKGVKQGTGIFAGKLFPRSARRVVTTWTADGGIVMDLPARGLQQWLFPMFGSYGQAKSALTQDGATGAYSAVHAPGVLSSGFTLQKGVPAVDGGTVEPFTYVGCKISEWEVACAVGEIAKLTMTIDARNELGGTGNSDPLNGSVPVLATYAPPPGGVFHFQEASLYTGGTCSTTSGVTTVSSPVKAGSVRSASVKVTTPLEVARFNLGNAGFKSEQLQNGLRAGGGQFVIEWLSAEAMYDAFAADTPTTLELQFLGGPIGSGSDFSTFTLLLPQVFLEGETPKIPGPEVITQTVPFSVTDDDTDNVVQATYWTLDTT